VVIIFLSLYAKLFTKCLKTSYDTSKLKHSEKGNLDSERLHTTSAGKTKLQK